MKLFDVSAVIVVGLLALQLVEACGPYSGPYPSHPFNHTNTNETKQLGFIPISSVLKLGAQRGLRECEKLSNESLRLDLPFIEGRLDPELPIFVNTTIPYATRETALIHAISSAAIAYELTLKCRYNIRGCKCVKLESSGTDSGCGDNFEFGQVQAQRLFKNLEKGNGARTLVNLHNNKVGREIVQTNQTRWCCLAWNDESTMKKCYMVLSPFETIKAALKQKFEKAVQVEAKDNKLYERVGDQLRPISSEDSRLVYLDTYPKICARNDNVGTPGMLGRTCRLNSTTNDRDCKLFIAMCNYCNLKHTTAVKYEQYECNCVFHWCCQVKCKTCTRPTLETTCVVNDEKPKYPKISYDKKGRRY